MMSFNIPLAPLGSSGVQIPEIGVGCMGMSFSYGSRDDEESARVLRKALELVPGVYFDTADMYGTPKDGKGPMHENERLLGSVISQDRDKFFIGSKFGNVRNEKGRGIGVDGSPFYVKQQITRTLEALQMSSIDLYYQHRIDPQVPIEETVGTMAKLVKEGKVKLIGLSECSPETLRRAHKVHPISAVQIEYSLWTPDIETNGIMDVCRELGITIVAYSPLGRGFLTGAYKSPDDFDADDNRRNHPRFSAENFPKNLELVEKVRKVAEKKGCTPAQLAIAWVIARARSLGVIVVTIPGTKKVKYLLENFGASNVKLSDKDLEDIQVVLDDFKVSGPRYPEAQMKSLGK